MHLHSPVDKLGRRRRRSKPQPRGKTYRDGPKLLKLAADMYRHGPLSRPYMQLAYGTTNLNTFQKRCTKWANGTELRPAIFFKPPELARRMGYLSEPDIYAHTPYTLQYLEAHGEASSYYHRSDQWEHRFMGGCVGFSTEYGIKEAGLIHTQEAESLSRYVR